MPKDGADVYLAVGAVARWAIRGQCSGDNADIRFWVRLLLHLYCDLDAVTRDNLFPYDD